MTLVFDTEPLVAFAFGEPGAEAVQQRMDAVRDGDRPGYVTTVNLTEFRYVAARVGSRTRANRHVRELERMGLQRYEVTGLGERVATLKLEYSPALGDAYAVAAAATIDTRTDDTTLLVGGDDDFDELATTPPYDRLLERFRDGAA